MTDEQRNDIVNYRIENAVDTLMEVLDHCENGYFNTAVNRLTAAVGVATLPEEILIRIRSFIAIFRRNW